MFSPKKNCGLKEQLLLFSRDNPPPPRSTLRNCTCLVPREHTLSGVRSEGRGCHLKTPENATLDSVSEKFFHRGNEIDATDF